VDFENIKGINARGYCKSTLYIAYLLNTSLNVLALYHIHPGYSSALKFVLHLLHTYLMLSELVTDSLEIALCVRLRTHNAAEPAAAFLPVQVNHRTAEPSLVALWKEIDSDLRCKIWILRVTLIKLNSVRCGTRKAIQRV
jgi:hypothetical protein